MNLILANRALLNSGEVPLVLLFHGGPVLVVVGPVLVEVPVGPLSPVEPGVLVEEVEEVELSVDEGVEPLAADEVLPGEAEDAGAEEPAGVEEDPVSDEGLMPLEDGPVTMEEGPLMLGSPTTLEGSPLTIEEGPVAVDEGPVLPVDDESMPVEDSPLMLEAGPLMLAENPLTVEEDPIRVKEDPVSVDEEPVPVDDGKPVPVDDGMPVTVDDGEPAPDDMAPVLADDSEPEDEELVGAVEPVVLIPEVGPLDPVAPVVEDAGIDETLLEGLLTGAEVRTTVIQSFIVPNPPLNTFPSPQD